MRLPAKFLLAVAAVTALLMPVGVANAGPGDGSVTTKIIGGHEALQPYPFMVSFGLSGSHWCGGALVAPEWVVSAKHCGWFSPGDTWFRIGVLDWRTQTDLAKFDRSVDHPTADLMLFHLTKPAKQAPLPIADATPLDAELRLIGWGCRADPGCWAQEPVHKLRQVDSRIVGDEQCVGPKHPEGIGLTEICVDNGDIEHRVGSCYGDSGGPALTKGVNGEWLLAGITSDGTTEFCAHGPSIYVDAAATKQWMLGVIAAG